MTVDSFLEALDRLDPDLAASLRSEVDRWQARPLPQIAVLGEYDTGKSSVLKRLCVQRGVPIPDHLRVGARPLTIDAAPVPFPEVDCIDTPGLLSGNPAHDAAALAVASESDGIALLLTPALWTGDAQTIERILGGWKAGVPLLIGVGRVDEVGVDPEDDAAGFAATVATKRTELLGRLKAWGVDEPPPICFFAADPYGLVGDTRTPGSEDFPDRPWDGMSAFWVAVTHLADAGRRRRPAAVLHRLRQSVREQARVERGRASEFADALVEIGTPDNLVALRSRFAAAAARFETEAYADVLVVCAPAIERIRGGEALTKLDVDGVTSAIAGALGRWGVQAGVQLSGMLNDSRYDQPSATPRVAAPAAPSGAPPLLPWAANANAVSSVINRLSRIFAPDDAKLRARVIWWRESRGLELVEDQVEKTIERSKLIGGGLKELAAAAPEALSLVDTLRGWFTESKQLRARDKEASKFEDQIRLVVGAALDGSPTEPGMRAWWRSVDRDLGAQIDAHMATRAEVERSQRRAEGRAVDLVEAAG